MRILTLKRVVNQKTNLTYVVFSHFVSIIALTFDLYCPSLILLLFLSKPNHYLCLHLSPQVEMNSLARCDDLFFSTDLLAEWKNVHISLPRMRMMDLFVNSKEWGVCFHNHILLLPCKAKVNSSHTHFMYFYAQRTTVNIDSAICYLLCTNYCDNINAVTLQNGEWYMQKLDDAHFFFLICLAKKWMDGCMDVMYLI